MLLAKAGVEVTVIEKRGTVGGRTSTMEQDGFKFDVGPTFFLYPQVLREIFAATGHSLEKEVPMYRLDPQYRLVFGGGGQVDATSDVERMKAQIAAISPRDAERLESHLKVGAIW
jgi:phytoene desaturase